jgi:hypothetical protein
MTNFQIEALVMDLLFLIAGFAALAILLIRRRRG